MKNTEILIPKYLKKDDVIAITCPAGHIDMVNVKDAITQLEKWGFKTIIGKTVGNGTNYFSGTDDERLNELQLFLDDDKVKAILMGRGGYGVSRIIDKLNFRRFKKNPKWICGFSDITLLHNHLQSTINCASLHSPMCAAFIPKVDVNNKRALYSLKSALMGDSQIKYSSHPNPNNRIGSGTGQIVGGNLSLVVHSIGTKSQVDTKNNILFIEDIGEHLYKIDRMMIQLKRAGLLKNLSGLIFGQFTDTEDTTRPFGKDLYQILSEHIAGYNYPVCFDFPVGHEDINYTLRMGMKHKLTVTDKKVQLLTII